MRFTPVALNQWEASTKSQPIATVTRRNGRFLCRNYNRALNSEELSGLLVFMGDREKVLHLHAQAGRA